MDKFVILCPNKVLTTKTDEMNHEFY